MADESQFNNKMTPFEQELSRLSPRTARLNRSRLMYEAGRSAMAAELGTQSRNWIWPIATGAMAVVAMGCAFLWATGGKPEVVVRTIYVPLETPSEFLAEEKPLENQKFAQKEASGEALRLKQVTRREEADRESAISTWLPPQSYLESRQIALAYGLDALPRLSENTIARNRESATYQDLLRKMTDEGG